MIRPIIALDIDDVLSRSAAAFIKYSNERWGHNHTLEHFTEQLQALWQVDQTEAERRWVEYMQTGAHGKYDVLADSKEVLTKLHERYRIIAVTSRRAELLDMTRNWVLRHYPGLVEEVVGSGIYGNNNPDAHKMTKAEVLRKIGAAYLIDDHLKHCNGAVEVGVTAVLFGDYPWNRADKLQDGITRCKDWAAVEKYFDGIG